MIPSPNGELMLTIVAEGSGVGEMVETGFGQRISMQGFLVEEGTTMIDSDKRLHCLISTNDRGHH